MLPVLTEYAETVLPYAQKKQPERPDPASVELAELEEKMRRIAAEMGEPSAAVPYLRQELESLHRKNAGWNSSLPCRMYRCAQRKRNNPGSAGGMVHLWSSAARPWKFC